MRRQALRVLPLTPHTAACQSQLQADMGKMLHAAIGAPVWAARMRCRVASPMPHSSTCSTSNPLPGLAGTPGAALIQLTMVVAPLALLIVKANAPQPSSAVVVQH